MKTAALHISYFITFLLAVSPLYAQQPIELHGIDQDLSCTQPHPRLLLDDGDFKQLRKTVNSCKSRELTVLHGTYMDYADESVRKDEVIEYKASATGKILEVSRDVLGQIGACSYAYRFTKDPKYSDRVETILNYVCDFPTWHPEHYLDVAEMSLAVALGYDWCYSKLSKKTKIKCENAIKEFLFDTAEDEAKRKRFRVGTNWGQVDNAGLLCSAIAFYELDADRTKKLIERAIRDNADFVAYNYAPDGINPEGPGYWGYGTSMQVIINAALEQSYGTDFGLSACPGFKESAMFITFATGPTGEVFNYSDGAIKKSQPALWYFADKFDNPGLAFNEVQLIKDTPSYKMQLRFGFIYVPFAAKVANQKCVAPQELLFSGTGKNPLMMARTGWTKSDMYVGAKGGGGKNNHAHLDAGTFVFDAYGKRWICEVKLPKYVNTEPVLKSIGANLWYMSQESLRWKVYGYNNLQHNTLTINGQDHVAKGCATLDEVWDESSRRGARFDLTPAFQGQADSVSRTICLVDEDHLEIEDYVKALPNIPADVYSNFSTKAIVNVTQNGIELTLDKDKMEIRAVGGDIVYTSGLVMPQDVPECLLPFYEKNDTNFAGIKYLVSPGESICIKTIIRKAP